MLTKVTISLFTVLLIALSVTSSHAVIILQNTRVNSNNSLVPITQSLAQTGEGRPGDFEVLMCATTSNGANTFLDPTPGPFSTLDQGSCGGGGDCILGIFTRFSDSSGATDNFCNWTAPTFVFGAGSFRYSGVDPDNPVIGYECDTGVGSTAVAPSIITEARSAVIRVFSLGTFVEFMLLNDADQVLQGSFFAQANAGTNGIAAIRGLSFDFPEEGLTGTDEFSFEISGDWRACTIALRMAPANIPTLSEWGLGIVAALFGIAAAWALRRRAARA